MSASGASTLQLAGYFLRLGALGFGGPSALIERMRSDLVVRRAWMSAGEFDLGMAIAATCPGPLAYQLAVYCGLARSGVRGAVVVAVAFTLPPFCLVVAVAALYGSFAELPLTRAIFYGVGPVVLALVARACSQLGRRTLGAEPLAWIIAAAGAVFVAATGTEHVAYFLGAGVLGMVWLAPRDGPPAALRPTPGTHPMTVTAMLPLALVTPTSNGLFLFFAKVGCLVFGSGLVIVPILRPAVVGEYGWLTDQQFIDAVAVGLVTPGPVVITATFIGFLVDGLPGALSATAGIFAPAVAFTIVAAPAFTRHGAHPRVRGFVRGITAAVVGALSGTIPLVAASVLTDAMAILIVASALVLLLWRRWPDPAVVALGAAVGILLGA